MQTCTVLAWFVLVIAVSLMESARPETETFLDRRHHKVIRVGWDTARANTGMILIFVNLAVCTLGMIVEYTRKRRFGVSFSRFLLAASFLTIFALVMYQRAL